VGHEHDLGSTLARVTCYVGVFVLASRWLFQRLYDGSGRPVADLPVARYFESALAAALAYSYYVAAALLAKAAFPQFLRDHLFDGLALAALVGFAVSRFPRDNPSIAFAVVRRPASLMVLLFIVGALIFGLIAATAVFGAGSDDFFGGGTASPVGTCAIWGGCLFPWAYFTMVSSVDLDYKRLTLTERTIWWFSKRPSGAAGIPQVDAAARAPTVSLEDAANTVQSADGEHISQS
jgi:hypothetical protein